MPTIVRNSPIKITAFSRKVMTWVKRVPKGRVATYGQIAALAGKPHGARGVGWILNSCAKSHKLPWQRVINSQGKISFPKRTDEFQQQRKLLLKEKVLVDPDGRVSLLDYGWEKKPQKARRLPGRPSMFRV